mmetsp:Transcript_2424/g.6130  ORF Transcript_2424/g.6130 Transcript_2424/m.6130 type:complete len:256 (+) Transcript_2424:65-832(+)
MASEATDERVVRRAAPDENDVLTQVVYDPVQDGSGSPAWDRSVERVKLFRCSKEALAAIAERKRWARFGAATGAQGKERGVSMVAHDEYRIEDPLSEEANQTGEERLIARIKTTIKSKGTHREEGFGDDFDSYVSARAPSASSSRAGSNQRYRASPSKFRGGPGQTTGPSPGRGFRAGPGDGRSASPAMNRAGNASNGPTRSPARLPPHGQHQQQGQGASAFGGKPSRSPARFAGQHRHTPPRQYGQPRQQQQQQ